MILVQTHTSRHSAWAFCVNFIIENLISRARQNEIIKLPTKLLVSPSDTLVFMHSLSHFTFLLTGIILDSKDISRDEERQHEKCVFFFWFKLKSDVRRSSNDVRNRSFWKTFNIRTEGTSNSFDIQMSQRLFHRMNERQHNFLLLFLVFIGNENQHRRFQY